MERLPKDRTQLPGSSRFNARSLLSQWFKLPPGFPSAMRSMRCFLLVVAALGQELPDDAQCQLGDCALQALQKHASKTSDLEHEKAHDVEVKASKASKAAGEQVAEQHQEAGFCDTDTKGTCSWFDCAASRNSECVQGKCVCKGNMCAKDGKCSLPTGYKLGHTSAQERDTGGSCMFFGCDSSRGPTKCDGLTYKCTCAEGFFSQNGKCTPRLEPTTNPSASTVDWSKTDWTKMDWSKVFQNYGWGATTDWSKVDWSKVGAGGKSLASPYVAPGYPGIPGPSPPSNPYSPYGAPNPYAYASPYGVPYWR
ncbi:unnamed protein product [Effrenium voratum]|uniref:Uncharacterized protein n=1 Tax=Effrenium voratum TaxID=2562239 RepID=A0AA36JC67_9DINO|nr:unnamed protein product [Effrenium voratum]